jgi:Domain of unknown function (DUF4142)/Thiamine pyrophosphate enzyme, N-terminal TPP binding domain
VLAICGQAEATVRGSSYQQELNLDRMFSDVACFVQEASSPAQVRHLIDRAVRIAIARNGVSAVILPKDIQDSEYEEPKVAHGFTRSGVGYSRPKIVPETADRADDHRSYQNQHRAEGHGWRRDEGRHSDRPRRASQKKFNKLKDAKPEDFAGEYDPMQVSAHKDAVSLFERYAKGGEDSKLKDWAGKTLPALRHHLEMAQAMDKNRK